METSSFKLLCKLCSPSPPRILVDALSDDDWVDLIGLARRHKVVPILVNQLRLMEVKPPEIVAADLDRHSQTNLIRAMRHSVELVRLTTMLDAEKIEFLAFKGLALLMLTDQELNQRHCGDMDLLLVNPNDLTAADELLRNAGYHRMVKAEIFAKNNPKFQNFFNFKDLVYTHPSTGIRLELHFSLFHKDLLPVTSKQLHENRSHIKIGSQSIPALSLQDHLIYLLVHGSVSGWTRLKWLVDIPLVSNNGEAYKDDAFLKLSQKLGVQRMVGQGLVLANNCLDMPVSDQVASYYKSSFATHALVFAATKVLNNSKTPAEYGIVKRTAYMHYKYLFYSPVLRKDVSYKLASVNPLLITLLDYEILPLPMWLRFLYYPLRPILWLVRLVKRRLNQ